jgi:outer membrane lipoprotein-sorting protein
MIRKMGVAMTQIRFGWSWGRMAAALALLAFALPRTANSAATDDVLARSRAIYASLRSYADTGTIEHEYGSAGDPSRDRHSFTTYFNRAPRHFYLEFRKQGVDRYVIWGDPDAFHTWWKTTGAMEDYPNPNNLGAFTTADYQTAGSAMKIPTLLYSKAPLQGPFSHFDDPVVGGMEEIGGHRCYRLAGATRDVYGITGREVNIRKMTVWIDAESFLIRRVREEPKGALPGQINRTTTTFEPQANPALDDKRFKFVPPEPK